MYNTGELQWYRLSVYNAKGSKTKYSYFKADDSLQKYYVYEYDANENQTSYILYVDNVGVGNFVVSEYTDYFWEEGIIDERYDDYIYWIGLL
jgi:hypothetical protein